MAIERDEETLYATVINVPHHQQSLVYLLISKGEVIYIGQTRFGLSRPFAHDRNFDFDTVAIYECRADELDALETSMIRHYVPSLPGPLAMSLYTVRMRLKADLGIKITKRKLLRIMDGLGICSYEMSGTSYIDLDEYNEIVEYIHETGC